MNYGQETRITEGGVFGPVFAPGVGPENSVSVTEGIVEFCLVRHNSVLMVEMTVEAAAALATRLHRVVAQQAPDLLIKDEDW